MEDLVRVECPRCSQETVALAPEGTRPVSVVEDHDPPLPPEADTAVRTTDAEGHEFVVYLQDGD